MPTTDSQSGAVGRLHFIGRLLHRPQTVLVRVFRRYLLHDPRWVLLTTRGRTSGLRREVLLPCGRTQDAIIVISAYGRRSNWFRNLERDSQVTVTCAGWVIEGRAEIVDEGEAKRAILAAHPFIPGFPLIFLPFILHPLLFPIARPLLLRFVGRRPLVVIRHASASVDHGVSAGSSPGDGRDPSSSRAGSAPTPVSPSPSRSTTCYTRSRSDRCG